MLLESASAFLTRPEARLPKDSSEVSRNRQESSKRVLRAVMSPPSKHFYQFGEFTLDVDQRVLLREGNPLPVTPKAFETLLILVVNSGRILEKDELMRRLWPDT